MNALKWFGASMAVVVPVFVFGKAIGIDPTVGETLLVWFAAAAFNLVDRFFYPAPANPDNDAKE